MVRPEPVMAGAEAVADVTPAVPASPSQPMPADPVMASTELHDGAPVAQPAMASADQSGPRHDPVAPAPVSSSITEFVHLPDEASEAPTTRPRRNPAKLWTMAAVAFFLLISGLGGALAYFGAPNWAVNLGMGSKGGETGLNFYLPKPPERRNLPTGEEYFAFSARILNDSDQELTVPPVVVELRDDQGRLVFSWMTKADKGQLKPNEEARVSESRLDIPKNARNLELRFVDNAS